MAHRRSLHSRCDSWLHGVLVDTPETFYRSVGSRVRAEAGDSLPVSACMHRAKKHAEQWEAVCQPPTPTSRRESVWGPPLSLAGLSWATIDKLLAGIVPSFIASAVYSGVRYAVQAEKNDKKEAEKKAVLSLTAAPGTLEGMPVEDIARQWQRVWVRVSKEVDEAPRQVEWDALGKLIHVSSKDLKTFFGV